MPLLRRAAGGRGAHLPPRERVPALTTGPGGAPPGGPGDAGGPDDDVALEVLARGELDVVGRITGASNATLLARVALDGVAVHAVYKPVAGEKPLWDFPDGTLAGREVASWLVSSAGGWGVVPPTVLRDGPYGPGSVQRWVGPEELDEDGVLLPVATDPGEGLVDAVHPRDLPRGWLTVVEGTDYDDRPVVVAHAPDPDLRRMALFDVVANNADRKGGHVLPRRGGAGRGGAVGVDHGLTFHTDPKVRTVLWGWAGEPIDDDGRARLEATLDAVTAPAAAGGRSLAEELLELLTPGEVEAVGRRAALLIERGRHPKPGPGGPALPWPLF